jgi:1-acyl-sn-glycerol-3-phosphate acyltransferase
LFFLRMGLMAAGFIAAGGYGVGLALTRRDPSRVAVDYARVLARLTQVPLGLQLEVEGEEKLTAAQPCVYVANHQSTLDVALLASIYPENTVVVAKREIRSIPLFGWIYEKTGNLLIDRSDRTRSVQQLQEAARAVREKGVSVWLFPEGTRGREPGRLLPLKKGAFQLALSAEVPIVPVVVQPLKPVFDSTRRHLNPGTVRIRVLDPIPTAGLDEANLPRLIETTWQRMSEALAELAATVESNG